MPETMSHLLHFFALTGNTNRQTTKPEEKRQYKVEEQIKN